MNVESHIVVEKLKSHIEAIISKYELANSGYLSLQEELARTKKELELKESRVKELEQKIELMQLAEVFTTSSADDVKEAKKKIAKIVKEIDKCISMLND